MTIVGLDPTSGPVDRSTDRRLAARPKSLVGEHLGVVVNGLGYCERFFDRLVDELLAHVDFGRVVKVVKPSVSVPPEPGDWSRLTEGATVAITGFGG
ncbi:MAG: hypothetical protein ACKOA9_01355 [Actinomycetota bacterium]